VSCTARRVSFSQSERGPDSEEALIGSVFARDFRVMRRLRSGGMGSVFVVEQISTGKERALKLLAPGLAENADVRERFVREARAASAIDSDHVVEIVSAGVDDATGTPFLVMELLRGEDLSDRVENSGPMDAREVAEVLGQVGHALELAHRQGIVHRDLKPENLFLAKSRRGDGSTCAKILDFGVAKLVNGDSGAAGTLPVGSPGYMAPEQTDAFGNITPAADVWSFGLVAFYLMTGASYWRCGLGASVPALLREVCFDPIEPPSIRAAELGIDVKFPEGFDEWFCHCVDREIEARFPDAGSAARGLTALFADSPGGVAYFFDDAPAPKGAGQNRQHSEAGVTMPPRGDEPDGKRDKLAKKALRAAARVALFGVLAGGVGGLAAFGVMGRSGAAAAASDEPVTAQEPTTSAITTATTTTAPPVVSATARPHASAARSVASASSSPKRARSASTAVTGGPCGGDMVALRNGAGAYCLDRTEVTMRAYLSCVASGKCPTLLGTSRGKARLSTLTASYSELCAAGDSELPVNCVSRAAASAYCQSAGARLPTATEWQAAARGPGGARFPWGNEAPDETRLNACGDTCRAWGYSEGIFLPTLFETSDGYDAPAPVGSYPLGASPAGVVDLLGNVAEWVATDDGRSIALGGSFLTGKVEQLTEPLELVADATSHLVGFRCAKKL
jgi:serine/threonine protein kinase/formylglycine-generating enzyme required for sulfatase activity